MKRCTGFTLIELIITVAIAAIVMAIGIPSFRDTIRENRLTTYNNQFITALNLARSEAINLGSTVTLCSSDGATCKSGGYQQGWIVFRNRSGGANPANAAAIIRVFEKLPEGMTLIGSVDSVSYTSIGTGTAGTWSLCKDDKGRGVEVTALGRIKSNTFTCP